MHIEDYGLAFEGELRSDRCPTLDEAIHAGYDPNGSQHHRFIFAYWHGKRLARLKLKFCPNVKMVFVSLDKHLYELIPEEDVREVLVGALPELTDHDKYLMGAISMG